MALRRNPRANHLNACRTVATMKRLPMLMHICVSRQRFRVYPSGRKTVCRESTCLRDGLMAKFRPPCVCISKPGVSVHNACTTLATIRRCPEITARISQAGLQDESRTSGIATQHVNTAPGHSWCRWNGICGRTMYTRSTKVPSFS